MLGFFEYSRMPQRITNAPSTFHRLMEQCIGELSLKQALVFLDDLIVFPPTLEEHEERLVRVLNQLKEYSLKLWSSFRRLWSTVKYTVSEKGIETDPEKIEALKTWPNPTLKVLRTFLGFCGYYRRFIKDYSKIVKSLNKLTAVYSPLRKWKLPFILHTDASTSGLGIALYQEQQGQKRIIVYAIYGLWKQVPCQLF